MPYWVHGRDAVTGEPGQMLSDAETPEAARAQAAAQGLVPDRVEFEPPAPAAPAEHRKPWTAQASWNVISAVCLIALAVWAIRLQLEVNELRGQVAQLWSRITLLTPR